MSNEELFELCMRVISESSPESLPDLEIIIHALKRQIENPKVIVGYTSENQLSLAKSSCVFVFANNGKSDRFNIPLYR
jgi:hypothetical protein